MSHTSLSIKFQILGLPFNGRQSVSLSRSQCVGLYASVAIETAVRAESALAVRSLTTSEESGKPTFCRDCITLSQSAVYVGVVSRLFL